MARLPRDLHDFKTVKLHLLITAVPGEPVIIAHVVDEIGKMECLSERFVAMVRELLSGRVPVVATVAQRGGGFIAEVKRREDCALWTLTRANRDALPFEIINRAH